MQKIFVLLFLFNSFISFGQEEVSISEILKQPTKYHHTYVTVKGYFDNRHKEGRAIYSTVKDCDIKAMNKALFLYESKTGLEKFNISIEWSGYIEVTAYFSSERKGSYDFFGGGLLDVQSIKVLHDACYINDQIITKYYNSINVEKQRLNVELFKEKFIYLKENFAYKNEDNRVY